MENCSKIRIAQVLGSVAEGGVETLVMNYYRNIDREKIQFDFFVENPSKIIRSDLIEAMGGRIIYIPKIEKLIFNQRKLVKLLKEGDYDIVHAQKTTLNYFYLKAAKKAGVRIRISHAHSTSNKKEWKKSFLKNLLRPFSKKYATHYFACSELAGRYLFGNRTFEKGLVYVVNNAIDINRFQFNQMKRDEIRKELKITDQFVVGNVGRIQPQKNHLFLIDIFNAYHKINKNSKLIILGDGPLRDNVIKKIELLKLEEDVILLGVKINPEDYYSAMDCFVLPSLYEGLPVVSIETQVNGLPLILSDNITREIVMNNNVDFLNLKQDAIIWAETISKYANHNHCSQILDKRMIKRYDIVEQSSIICDKYEELINEVSEKKNI